MRKIKAQADEFQGGPRTDRTTCRASTILPTPRVNACWPYPCSPGITEGWAGVKQRWPENAAYVAF